MAQPTGPQPNLGKIFDAMNAYQISMSIKGALALELFTHIDEGIATAEDHAKRSGATLKGVRVVCDFLAVNGLLAKQDGRYSLPLDSKFFLSKHSPAYVGAAVNFLHHPRLMNCFSDLSATMMRGGATDDILSDEGIWEEYARSMTGIVAAVARAAAALLQQGGPIRNVLDIAAGHGLFGIQVAQSNPEVHVTALDSAAVLKVAVQNATVAGVDSRYTLLSGSAFDVDLGSGYDLVLLPNFIHALDFAPNVALLKRIREAMAPGGRIAVIEFVPNEDRISPPSAAAFGLMMLGSLPGGDAYTFAEIAAMLMESGFKNPKMEDLLPTPQRMVTANA